MKKIIAKEKGSLATTSLGPIAIGGVGGSGTRVFAQIAKQLGMFIGSNLNVSEDNMSFPRLGDYYKSKKIYLNYADKLTNMRSALAVFDKTMLLQRKDNMANNWGWKVPTTFLHLEELSDYYGKEFRYVHILRNGLDMAFSSNQNQVRQFGEVFDVDISRDDLPVASLRYWVAANQYAIFSAKKYLPNRFIIIRFEDLCSNSIETVRKFAEFCSLEVNEGRIESAAKLVKAPSTIGRYMTQNLDVFSEEEIEAVKSFGFCEPCK